MAIFGFFHWLIGNNTTLQIVDFLNIWGLILIGTFLFIGLFTRAASISGALLLLLYYIANPPFVYSSMPATSHFYIINYNLIEAVVLIVIASLPRDYLWSVQRYIAYFHEKQKNQKFPASDNHTILETTDNSQTGVNKKSCCASTFWSCFFWDGQKKRMVQFRGRQPGFQNRCSQQRIIITGEKLLNK